MYCTSGILVSLLDLSCVDLTTDVTAELVRVFDANKADLGYADKQLAVH